MNPMKITLIQARRFILTYQGLYPPYAMEGKTGILDYIRRVGCIQYDPINVVGRNPELVLHARIADYTSEMLESLLYEDRALLDGWDKMMSIYAVEDWPYFQRYRDAMQRYYGSPDQPAVKVLPMVREIIRKRGPVSSIDIDLNETVDWSWAPTRMARAALDSMYTWGELIVHHKVNTRKFYDFAANHIPYEYLAAPDPFRRADDYQDWHVLRRIGSTGLIWNRSGNNWLAMRGVKSKERQAAFKRLLERNKIIPVEVKHFPEPLYVRSTDYQLLESSLSAPPPSPQAVIIAPLDNLLWGRKFVEALFDFRYRWEVYKPVAKREYGYYVLPILYGDKFVGRFEPGWDKKHKHLIIKQWWWEPGIDVDEGMKKALKQCFKRFARFRKASSLHVASEANDQANLPWLEGKVG